MAEIYVPGAIDIMGSANQMMQFRNSQQAQQANALQMQYAAEDRARAEQGRRAAAGNALAERAALSKALENSVVGMAGPEQPNLGNAQKDLAMQGRFGLATDISKLQSQFANQQKAELEATGQGLTNEGIRATNTGTDYKNTADFIKMTNAQIDAAPDIASLRAIVAATFTPDHPMAKFNELNGLTLEQSMAAIDGLIAQGKTFEQIREQMSQGASKAADNIAARGLVTAQTDKAKGEAGGAATGASVEERNRALYAKAMQDPEYVKTAEYAALYNMSFGEKIIEMPDPNDNSKIIFQRVSVPAPKGFPLPTFGQQPNALAPAPVAAQPTNALAMNAGGYGGGPMPTPQTSTAMQPIRTETGEGMLASVVAPSSARETFDLKQKETELGRPKVTVTVQKMMDSFNELDKLGAIVNDEKPINENFMAMLSGGVFADALPLINPKAATRRGVLKTLTETAISQIAAAAGLTAKQMDSNADVKRIRVMVSGPEEGFTIQAVRESLINLDAAFGTGTVKSTAPATATSDKIARSVDIEHTAKQNKMSLEDTKTRLRSMGYKIEGE